MNEQSQLAALQSGYELHWYRIENVLGQGAFGITYLAHDINLDRQVAIKEYLPGQFSVRNKDLTVRPTTDAHKEDFEWGLKRFVSEAKTLTKFEHPNLVRVFNVFEMNNTAYMVMNYEVGKSLQQILKSRKTLNETELMKILLPLLAGLEVMHEKGFVHRDIKPGNIYIRHNGTPVLLDFGSARQTRAEQGREFSAEQETITTLISPGYAPIEQYGSTSSRQGPWTDIYGLGATLYKAITGKMPVPAVDRSETLAHDMVDNYLPVSILKEGQYSEKFLAAIDHALVFKADERPQSVEAWHAEFTTLESENIIDTVPEIQSLNKVQDLSGEEDTVKFDVEHEAVTINLNSPSEMETEKIGTAIPAQISKPNYLQAKWLLGISAVAVIFIFLIANIAGNREQKEIAVINDDATTIFEASPANDKTIGLSPQQKTRIENLLQQAELDIEELRLTSPNENNALNKYLTVLIIDENNMEAKAGIQTISDEYISLAYAAMQSGNLAKAGTYIDKAESVNSESDKIPPARNALQAKHEEQKLTANQQASETEKSGGLWEKLKKWNEENKPVEREDSAMDKTIKESFK